MKKALLIITTFCISILNVCAQITITTADMAIPTKVVYQSNDSLSTVSIGNAGTGQTWDFTAAVEETKDTSYALPYSSVPNTLFSAANLVIQQGNQNFYGYLINSASSLSFIGGSGVIDVQGYSIAVNQTYSNSELVFSFPTSYDSSYSSNYNTNIKSFFGQTVNGFTVDSVQQRSSIQKTFLVDGWGTLTTQLPGGPYDVLRIKTTKITHDTTTAYISMFGGWMDIATAADSTTTFSWWANGIGTALAVATMDSTGGVGNLQWLTAPPALPTLTATASHTNSTCPGTCDGTAYATANWGVPPFTYSWNTNPAQNSDSIINLCAGTYVVTITDSLNATATDTITITEPLPPHISAYGSTLTASGSGNNFHWYLNGTVIAGATSGNYQATQNGVYTVSFTTGGGCTDTSSAYNVTNIGISESTLDNSITVFPSPATNLVTIKFDASSPFLMASASKEIMIEINNELGQNLTKTVINQMGIGKNEITLDITDLPAGVYFIRIQNESTTGNKKFIKQ